MTKPFRLIVTDTSPLFTLVLADSLDVLIRPGLPVSIPDAVYVEATRVHGAPGAEQIVQWINDHLDVVRIVPTDIGIDQQGVWRRAVPFAGLANWQRSKHLNDFSVATQAPRRFFCSRILTSRNAGRSLMTVSRTGVELQAA